MDSDIAIIGLAGRYPGCASPDELFDALLAGRDLATEVELAADGRVMRHFALEDVDKFDHAFFGYTPFEAMVMDPQARVLLTCAYRALEDAGYEVFPDDVRVGVFASGSISTYLLNNVIRSRYFDRSDLNYKILLGNDKDTLATRISYKLNLTGPSVTIQSACSSSLVATHFACQSLLAGDCDVALVGAVSITVPQAGGYDYKDGSILAQDGVCRPFDLGATGTLKGNGCSVVLLRRAADASREKDTIRAILRGTAVNNDGGDKIGFTAPSVRGQSAVIEEAWAFAGIEALDLDYIETHGTGTKLGDQIELTSLARSVPAGRTKIPLGAVKANVGHLDVAAGLTSMIKAVMMLERGMVPPIGNLRLETNMVEAATARFSFPTHASPQSLRAIAVSAFGIGGTNAHAILRKHEGATDRPERTRLAWHLVPLSVNTSKDWDAYRHALIIRVREGVDLLDLAASLATRRKRRALAFALVVADGEDLAAQLERLSSPARRHAIRRRRLDPEAQAAVTRLLPGLARRPRDASGVLDSLLSRGEGGPAARDRPDTARDAEALREFLTRVASAYRTEDINLADLYAGLDWRPTALPPYPLRAVRHWIDAPAEAEAAAGGAADPGPDRGLDTPAQPDLVERIQDIWQAFIGGERPAPDICFVDTGADSFTAIEIVDKINDTFGCNIRIDSSVASLTARAIAAEILGGAQAAAPWLTSARLGSLTARTLFLIHPAGGGTYNYSRLGRLLQTDLTVCGIDLPEVYQGYGSISALAAAYSEAILGRAPAGPLLIGGYSFGGNVAHEIARQMERRGTAVESVVMFDSHPPEVYNTYARIDFDYVEAFPTMMACYFKPSLLETVEREAAGVATLDEAIAIARRLGVLDTRLTDADLGKFFDRWVFSHGLLKRHRPEGPASANLLVFEAQDAEPHSLFEHLKMRRVGKAAWSQYFSGDVKYVSVPGDHFTMFSERENLKVMAATLDDCIRYAGWDSSPVGLDRVLGEQVKS